MDNLVNIKIDGKEYKVKEGKGLIETAKENGIYIPSLCHYEHINPPLATCRVCTVNVNGRPITACTEEIKDGMEVEVNTPELIDMRKALVEMMYAEGNHFCPSCEKSGNCDLQHLGYEMGVSISRFPHLFNDKAIDFNPKRMVIEHNRCILCRRCVEEVITDDDKFVFTFSNRGNHTVVSVDYEQEANLTEEQAIAAMNLCPVGAILVRGKSIGTPFGGRKYDTESVTDTIPLDKIKAKKANGNGKMKIATTSLAGCFGCHMSMLDIDLELLELLEFVEFNKSPITDIKEFDGRCDIGLIEGGCCNTENIEVLREFRKKCDILVAVGECSIWGGLPAMRNTIPLRECMVEAYHESLTCEHDASVFPRSEDLPKILDKVYPCNDLVKIDYFIPGCPPNANLIWKMVKNILFGEKYSIIYSEFKYD